MSLWEVLRTALTDIARHKFRSILAMLGIIFGVASVEAMMSIGEGARRQTLSRIEALGIDNIVLRSVRPSVSEAPPPTTVGRRSVASYGLLRRDLAHIRLTFPGIQDTAGVRDLRKNLFSSSGHQLDVAVLATEPAFLRISRSRIVRGRFLCDLDGMTRKRVCVLGAEAARRLFRLDDATEGYVRIGGTHFNVVGILENDAGLTVVGGKDIRDCVFVPLATARSMYGDVSFRSTAGKTEVVSVQLDAILLRMADVNDVAPAAERLRHYLGGDLRLGKRHKVADFELDVPLSLMKQKAESQRIFSVVMASIAGISLLIGGIGIMNVQLANVADRRKEIGTRRALGARRRDILRQFVLEAATLTTLGGLAGTGIGYALANAVSRYAGWPTVITSSAVVLGLGVSCAVGILFGLWPAWLAARVRPIEALRSE